MIYWIVRYTLTTLLLNCQNSDIGISSQDKSLLLWKNTRINLLFSIYRNWN